MKLWRNSVIDWFVAESAEEAADMARKYYTDVNGIDVEDMDLDFHAEPDSKPLKFWNDGGDEDVTTKTAAQWAAENPKGFWGSTEF